MNTGFSSIQVYAESRDKALVNSAQCTVLSAARLERKNEANTHRKNNQIGSVRWEESEDINERTCTSVVCHRVSKIYGPFRCT